MPDAIPYDFRRPHRISKERLRTLEAMYERLVQSVEGWLMGRVRGQLELRLERVEQLSFGEFTASLSTPCAAYIIDVRDAGGLQGVINFGGELAYFLVDRLFGGSGGATVMARALTPVERLAIRVVADRITNLLVEIWRDHIPLELALSGFESIPEILQACNREDPVLVAHIRATAAGTPSMLSVCLPFAVLDKFFNTSQQRVHAATGSTREIQTNRELTETSLRQTHVPVVIRLPEFRLSMREVAALSVGRILTTGIPRDSATQVLIGDAPRFGAAVGRVGGRIAVRLTDTLQPPDGAHPGGSITHEDS